MSLRPALTLTLPRQRSGQDEGYVLLTRPWRETSLMVECWTLQGGRRMMMARGARRAQSLLRGQMLPFHRLSWHWRGVGEVVNVSRVEWLGKIRFMPRQSLLSAHYLNELLHRLLPQHDPHPKLYQHYAATMALLADSAHVAEPQHHKIYLEACLRRFEVRLLQEIGYGLRLDETAESGNTRATPIQPDAPYYYELAHGFIPWQPHLPAVDKISGASALEMNRWLGEPVDRVSNINPDLDHQATLRRLHEQKLMLRRILNELLHHQPLHSRKMALRVINY